MKEFISYSEIRLWYQDKKEYLKRYVNGIETPPTPAQELCKIVHSALEDECYPWLRAMKGKYPRRTQVNARKVLTKLWPLRLPEAEAVITATTKDGIRLLGIFDGLDRKQRKLVDYKTFTEREPWSQWIVDDQKQFSFYAWLWHLTYHSYFSDIEIDAINLGKGTVRRFHTVRDRGSISYIEGWAMQSVREMKQTKIWNRRLSKKERLNLNQSKLI